MVVGASCLSPTIPLPPPDHPSSVQLGDRTGIWVISGSCYAAKNVSATITVINTNTHEGVLIEDFDSDGRYTVEIEGEQCDPVEIRQQLFDDDTGETQTSAPTTILLAPYSPGDPDESPLCK
jgi:hypothetical protein